MRNIIFLTLALLISGLSFAQDIKIGYINVDYIVTSSPQYIKAKKESVEKFKPQKDDLIKQSLEVKELIVGFNKNKENFSEDELKQKVEKIRKLEEGLKQKTVLLQQQVNDTNIAELAKIEDLINDIVRQVAEDEGFDLILYQNVAHASDKINITDLISKRLRVIFAK